MTLEHQELLPPPPYTPTLSPGQRPTVYILPSTTPHENPNQSLFIQRSQPINDTPPSYEEAVSCGIVVRYETRHQLEYSAPALSATSQRISRQESSAIVQNFIASAKYDSAFKEDFIRNTFLRKVYSLITLQMLIILGIINLFLMAESSNHWTYSTKIIWSLGTIGVILTVGAMAIVDITRKFPLNTIAMVFLTLGLSLLGSTVSYYFETRWVIEAATMVACVCLALAIFATECCYSIVLTVVIVPTLYLTMWYTWLNQEPSARMELVFASIAALSIITYVILTVMTTVTLNENSISHNEIIFTVIRIYFNIPTYTIVYFYKELARCRYCRL